jgi:Na+:H+ antiporter, NhaA family
MKLPSDETKKDFSPLKEIGHGLHPWITFFILPMFAFVNAGVDMRNLSADEALGNVPLGIALGLKIASMPRDSSWLMLYGVSVLTGIGFTMSLFVDSLAFVDDRLFAYADKLAILLGTLISAIFGYIILKFAILQKECNEKESF